MEYFAIIVNTAFSSSQLSQRASSFWGSWTCSALLLQNTNEGNTTAAKEDVKNVFYRICDVIWTLIFCFLSIANFLRIINYSSQSFQEQVVMFSSSVIILFEEHGHSFTKKPNFSSPVYAQNTCHQAGLSSLKSSKVRKMSGKNRLLYSFFFSFPDLLALFCYTQHLLFKVWCPGCTNDKSLILYIQVFSSRVTVSLLELFMLRLLWL